MTARTEIQSLEERLRLATLTGDVHTLGELLSDRLVFTNQVGARLTKLDDIAAHASGLLQLIQLDFHNEDVRELPGAIIVRVEAAVEGRYDGEPFGGSFAYTRLWVHSGARWQIECAHCSPLAAAP